MSYEAMLAGGNESASSRESNDEKIFRDLYPRLRRFAAVVGGLDVAPDDLVQEAVVRTLRLHRLSELDNASAYLRRAIVNVEQNRRRSRDRGSRAMRLVTMSDGTAPEYPSDLDMLRTLSPVDRAAVYLVTVEGSTYREAASVLGLSDEATRKRVARALTHLREAMEQEGSHG